MSAAKMFVISCDAPGCPESLDTDQTARPAEQRRKARREGWFTRPGGAGGEGGCDFCPDHAAEYGARVEAQEAALREKRAAEKRRSEEWARAREQKEGRNA